MTTLNFLQAVLDWLLADPSHIVAAAATVAALTPTPDPTTVSGKLYKVLEIFALNILRAKDAGEVPSSTPAPTVQPK